MTPITLPAPARRTGSTAESGAERLTFRSDASLGHAEAGSIVAIPTGETFEVIEVTRDPARRTVFVVRPKRNPEKETTSMTTETPVKPLATVEISVPTTMAPPENGGYGRVVAQVIALPKPASLTGGHGVAGAQLALTYTDRDAIEAIDATWDPADPSAYFTIPGDGHGLRLVRRQQAGEHGAVFFAEDGGLALGDLTMRRRQAEANATSRERKRLAENAEAERLASDEARAARFAAVEQAYAALPRADQLGFLASKCSGLEGAERFKVTSAAAVGLS